jgi:hypothetical protein
MVSMIWRMIYHQQIFFYSKIIIKYRPDNFKTNSINLKPRNRLHSQKLTFHLVMQHPGNDLLPNLLHPVNHNHFPLNIIRIPHKIIDQILQANNEDLTLREVLDSFPKKVVNVEDDSILKNINTPGDYRDALTIKH